MDKDQILHEIRRTAEKIDGGALGSSKFESETGIRRSDWLGKYWARWSDALLEAGFAPNQLNPASPVGDLLEKYAKFAKELGRLPYKGDMLLKASQEAEFPHDSTFARRIGSKAEIVRQLEIFCGCRNEYHDVVDMCRAYIPSRQKITSNGAPDESPIGFVYLLQHGSRREYKIGRTMNPLRREGEIGIQLPEKIQPIHVIKTDDSAGIEAYWHRRFASKRKEGEWFALTASDVRAFTRWKRIY